jgi:hypothetical protein
MKQAFTKFLVWKVGKTELDPFSLLMIGTKRIEYFLYRDLSAQLSRGSLGENKRQSFPIVNGVIASRAEFPWMALLGKKVSDSFVHAGKSVHKYLRDCLNRNKVTNFIFTRFPNAVLSPS